MASIPLQVSGGVTVMVEIWKTAFGAWEKQQTIKDNMVNKKTKRNFSLQGHYTFNTMLIIGLYFIISSE